MSKELGASDGTYWNLLEGAYDVSLTAREQSVWVDSKLVTQWDDLQRGISRCAALVEGWRYDVMPQHDPLLPGRVWPLVDLCAEIVNRMIPELARVGDDDGMRMSVRNLMVVHAHLWQVWQMAQQEHPDASAWAL